jgi:hypothetical protein
MKNSIFSTLLCFVLAGFAWHLQGCSTTVTDVELDYREQLVIYGALVDGLPVRNIQITRTLPPLDTFNVERSRITTAEGAIVVDGVSYPLRLQARVAPMTAIDSLNFNEANQPSLYEAPGLTAQAGKTYALRVRWENKEATASTRVPFPPELNDAAVEWRPEPFRYVQPRPQTFPATGVVPSLLATAHASVRARDGEAYRIATFAAEDTVSRRSTSNIIAVGTSTLFAGAPGAALAIRSQTRFFLAGDSIFKPIIFTLATANTVSSLHIVAHDGALLRYVETQARNSPTGSPFGGSGQNPLWNVEGDGIGLFIGESKPRVARVSPR